MRGRQPDILALGDAEIAFHVYGSGSALVFIHAGVADSRMWTRQAEVFSVRRRVVLYDLRGFGKSTLPPGPFSHVADLEALLDHLEINRAVLVGASFGGKTALDFTLTSPGRVAGLVLVSSAVAGWVESEFLRRFDRDEDRAFEDGDLEAAVELNLRMWVDGPTRRPEDSPRVVREFVATMQRDAFELQGAAYSAEPLPGPCEWLEPPALERLGNIAAPTLVLTGALDIEDFREIGRWLIERIPRARGAVIESAAHIPSLERPDEFERLVGEFLDEISGEPVAHAS